MEEIILISERPTEARDNGYWLFKYIREYHSEINIYYVITKDSVDFNKIEKLGNYIIYDSKEHKDLFDKAEILICTHTRGTLEPSVFEKTTIKKTYPEYYNKKYIFIQHGINVGGFISAFNSTNLINANFSKIISGALPEYRYLNSNLGYSEDVVKYTGLARFDSIINKKDSWSKKNKIIFIPTWRANICSPSYKKEKMFNDFRFLKSNYYSKLLSFLNNKKLEKHLVKNDLELHFIPHPEVTKYLHYITSSCKNIKIINPANIDIQTELIEAKLLITDYSSIFFDFVYMKKPVIFYQFDKKDFFENHYKKGFFDFHEHYFGDVIDNEQKLINKINKIIKKGFLFPKDAELTHKQFFLKYDNNNCERIYNEILNCMKKKQ